MILNIETDSISSNAKILTIQVKTKEGNKIWAVWDYANEQEMLKDFIQWFLSSYDKIIIGFNLLKFDLPILFLKSKELPNFGDFFLKVNRANVVDLFVYLTFINKGRLQSLDHYCKQYGIPREYVSKKEFVELCKKGEYAKLEKLIASNLNSIYMLYEKVWSEKWPSTTSTWKPLG